MLYRAEVPPYIMDRSIYQDIIKELKSRAPVGKRSTDLSKVNSILMVDKPLGISSNDCLQILKSFFRINFSHKLPKIGHGGTLDPLASGALPVALGEATKVLHHITMANKTYLFTIWFGVNSTSLDLGTPLVCTNETMPSKPTLIRVLQDFIGQVRQTPPCFSALKVSGVRSYELARSGTYIELPERKVEVYDLRLVSYKKNLSRATFIAKVSKGFYIRSLARDIAEKANSVGIVSYLRRLSVGTLGKSPLLSVKSLYNNANIWKDFLIPISQALDDIPVLRVNYKEALWLFQGNTSLFANNYPKSLKCGTYQVHFEDVLVSLIRVTEGEISILRNFNLTNKFTQKLCT